MCCGRQLHERRGPLFGEGDDRGRGRSRRKFVLRPDDVRAALAVGSGHSGEGSVRHRAQQGWEGTRNHGGRIRL